MSAAEDKDNRDSRLQKKITSALKQDKDLAGYDINVRVVQGKATLQGIVDVMKDKNHAHRIAASVEGVGEIENNLTISTDGAVSDQDIQNEILQEIEGNPHLHDMRVKVSVHQGEVTLTGMAESAAQKQELWDTVSKAMGVKAIHDHISVATGEETDDADITNEIQRVFLDEGISDYIHVTTRKNIVTLSGKASIKERNRAIEVAAQVPGVKRVEAHLIDTTGGEISRAARAVKEIKSAFSEELDPANPALNIYEEDGHLVLEGIVADLQQKQLVDKKLHTLMEEFGRDFVAVENKIRLLD